MRTGHSLFVPSDVQLFHRSFQKLLQRFSGWYIPKLQRQTRMTSSCWPKFQFSPASSIRSSHSRAACYKYQYDHECVLVRGLCKPLSCSTFCGLLKKLQCVSVLQDKCMPPGGSEHNMNPANALSPPARAIGTPARLEPTAQRFSQPHGRLAKFQRPRFRCLCGSRKLFMF